MERLKINQIEPNAMSALLKLEQYLSGTSIPKKQRELIKIRASQINGCAYCTNMHLQDARKGGETEVRLGLICVWREASDLFTEEERLTFAITEEITLIHQHGLSDTLYENAVLTFGEKKTAEIIMNVIIINTWNRLAVSLQTKPEVE